MVLGKNATRSCMYANYRLAKLICFNRLIERKMCFSRVFFNIQKKTLGNSNSFDINSMHT